MVPRPLTPEALAEILSRDEVVDPIAHLLKSFLSLFKGNCFTLEEARRAASISSDPARCAVFLDVFEEIFARYEDTLRATAEIDFNDMIILELGHEREIASGESVDGLPIVPDAENPPVINLVKQSAEQASPAPPDVLKLVHQHVPIGRGEPSLFHPLGGEVAFGFTRRTDLDQTYRFNDKLLSATSKFVLQNPAQLRKTLVAARRSELPAIVILSKQAEEEYAGLLRRVLDRIRSEAASGSCDVLVVGRYNHTDRSLGERRANRIWQFGSKARRRAHVAAVPSRRPGAAVGESGGVPGPPAQPRAWACPTAAATASASVGASVPTQSWAMPRES